MTDFARHPARSAEFLSRLHDGDLSAAERAQFESHRAHCAPCRNAAAQFETALALYRSSRPRPAGPDLSARILRKLQAASPRRSVFGVRFGIDLRWAGAFAAALLAVIVGSTVVVRREASERRMAREAAPIPVVVDGDRTGHLAEGKPKDNALDASSPGLRSRDAGRAAPPALAAPKDAATTAGRFAAVPPASRALADSEQAPTARVEKEASASRVSEGGVSAKLEGPPPAVSPKTESPATSSFSPERPGGEGAMSYNVAVDLASVRARLEILPLDGAGTPPALVGGTDTELPADLRGRVFILFVEAGGQVREVRPAAQASRKKAVERQQAARADAPADAGMPQALKDLRFEPGGRSRILRVRVE